MATTEDALSGARQRIQAAYDPTLLRSAADRLAELLACHAARVQASELRVLNWEDPERLTAAANELLERTAANDATDGAAPAERFAGLVATMLARGHNLHDPRYMGHQVPASVPLAGLFDAVGSVTNQVMAIYEIGPWATAVERSMVEKLGEAIGFSRGSFAGLVTNGGSLANLTALLTARNVALGEVWQRGTARDGPPPVIVVHRDAHYSVVRTAGILGLGTEHVVRTPLDDRGRIDPRQLDRLLGELREQGQPIVAVVACCCATPIGAFDPLSAIADVCEKHGVWLHVDAAHGGAACLSRRHRQLTRGLERADSVVCDAHKMLFIPALCAFVFYKQKRRQFEAFRQDAPYLFDPSAPGMAEYDSGMKTVECTKRAAAFGLWGVWAMFGPELFEDMIDVTFDLGRQFHRKLTAAADFVPLHEPECNIVVFRHVPKPLRDAPPERLGAFQLELRRRVIESGEAYLVPSQHGGAGALRVTLINPLTTPEHLDQLLDTLRRHAAQMLGEEAGG